MRTWKDKIWQLTLVIVGALILSFCNTGLNRTAKNDNGTSTEDGGTSNGGGGIAPANGFKPSDISGIMICDGYRIGQFTGCYKDSSSSSFSISISSLFSQGWRPVGPLQNMAAQERGSYTNYYSTSGEYIIGLKKSAILFYK